MSKVQCPKSQNTVLTLDIGLWALDSLSLWLGYAKFADETVQVGAADAETLGGSDLVAFAFDRSGNDPALERGNRAFKRRFVGHGSILGQRALHLFGEKLYAE